MSLSSDSPLPSSTPVETFACRICGEISGHEHHLLHEVMYGTHEPFDYLECGHCHCLQLVTIPNDLGKYYPGNYYSYDLTEDKGKQAPRMRKALKHQFALSELGMNAPFGWFARKRYPHWAMPPWVKTLGLTFTDPILDVGSGSGTLLLELCERGFTNLIGIDPYLPKDIIYPCGVTIYKRRAEDMTGTFKVVYANHVFEHLDNPLASLVNFARLIESGSYVVLTVPVFPNGIWERYGENWAGFDPPRHIFLHNQTTMSLLASGAGLAVDHVMYSTAEWCFTLSEAYCRGLTSADHDPKQYLSPEQIAKIKTEVQELNTTGKGDQATFILRKL